MDKPSRMFQLSRLKACREGMGEGQGSTSYTTVLRRAIKVLFRNFLPR